MNLKRGNQFTITTFNPLFTSFPSNHPRAKEMACVDSGLTWSRLAFIFAAGRRQSASLKSNSSHSASVASSGRQAQQPAQTGGRIGLDQTTHHRELEDGRICLTTMSLISIPSNFGDTYFLMRDSFVR
ncbi:hypothetical protein [Orrella sp. 11846]|uniref:hypothetical protein n=1 Tax=Orrella sp. 11846 TaxID=3409913 RepID=UPI003B590EB0